MQSLFKNEHNDTNELFDQFYEYNNIECDSGDSGDSEISNESNKSIKSMGRPRIFSPDEIKKRVSDYRKEYKKIRYNTDPEYRERVRINKKNSYLRSKKRILQ